MVTEPGCFRSEVIQIYISRLLPFRQVFHLNSSLFPRVCLYIYLCVCVCVCVCVCE
jgi:hypothetical protein